MIKFDIIAHQGMGPIRIGMERSQVHAVMHQFGFEITIARSTTEKFCNAAIEIEYVNDIINYIGISYFSEILLTYEEHNVFDTEAEKLFQIIAANEHGEFDYNDYDPLFPDQIISLFDADRQYDKLGGNIRAIWATVGIGSHGYLAAMNEIRLRAR